jgi:hypothetical protein
VNTAIAITAIIAAALIVNSIVVAVRDVAQTKRKATATTAESAVARVRELHREASHGETCVHCAPLQRIGYDTTWPCDTIRAIDGAPASKENEA